MDNLGAHIIEVLRMNHGVHLPGIGTFKKKRIPAKFDKKSNSYLAPIQHILLENQGDPDSLIINSIAKDEGISLEEGERKLLLAITAVKQEIETKGEGVLTGFGKLIKNNGGYDFIAENNDSLPLYKAVNELKLITPSDEIPLPLTEEAKPAETTGIEIEPNVEIDSPANKWLWPVLLIAFIAVGGTMWFLKPFSQQQVKETIVSPIDSTATAVSGNNSVAQAMKKNLSLPTDTSSNLVADSSLTTAGIKRSYEIIIVSFGTLSEAEKYVAEMNGKGYKIRILENHKPGNLYKISYSSYSTEEEARKELVRIKKELAKDAWILKNNHL